MIGRSRYNTSHTAAIVKLKGVWYIALLRILRIFLYKPTLSVFLSLCQCHGLGRQARPQTRSRRQRRPMSGSNWGEGTEGGNGPSPLETIGVEYGGKGKWLSRGVWVEATKGGKGLYPSPIAWTPQFQMQPGPSVAPYMMQLPPGPPDSSGLWNAGWHEGTKAGYREGY